MRRRATAWIGFGGNQGPVEANFRSAGRALSRCSNGEVEVSGLYRTAPWGDPDQPDFLNTVARLVTDRTPAELLAALQAIEARHGRRRDGARRWGPRTLDLDLLLVGEARLNTPELTLPHPRLHERVFVLSPIAELDPDLHVPGRGAVSELLSSLPRKGIERVAGPEWFSA